MSDYDALRKLEQAATPGPWKSSPGVVWAVEMYGSPEDPEWQQVKVADTGEDAAFIAAARNALPRLLDELAEMRAKLEAMETHRIRLIAAGDALSKIVETTLREKGFSEEAMRHWPQLIEWADAAAQQEKEDE